MALEFSEFHPKKKYRNKRRKIPIFRMLLLGIAIYFLIQSGYLSKIKEFFFPHIEEYSSNSHTQCAKFGGTSFVFQDSLVQCSWVLGDTSQTLPNAFLRYIASTQKKPKAKIHWIAQTNDFSKVLFVRFDDSLSQIFLHIQQEDSSYVWINDATGCKFPGLCPKLPLDWSSLNISEDFDFEGKESLLAADVFWGIGEAPVHSVLNGKILKTGKDSLGAFIEINHGNNISSRIFGLAQSFVEDSLINTETPIGRLAPKDSAQFYLSLRQNGLFMRWKDFYRETHPLDTLQIKQFKERLNL